MKQELDLEIKRVGSQPSTKGPADWFAGTVRIDPLFHANPSNSYTACRVKVSVLPKTTKLPIPNQYELSILSLYPRAHDFRAARVLCGQF
jgi:hypothetical protein